MTTFFFNIANYWQSGYKHKYIMIHTYSTSSIMRLLQAKGYTVYCKV